MWLRMRIIGEPLWMRHWTSGLHKPWGLLENINMIHWPLYESWVRIEEHVRILREVLCVLQWFGCNTPPRGIFFQCHSHWNTIPAPAGVYSRIPFYSHSSLLGIPSWKSLHSHIHNFIPNVPCIHIIPDPAALRVSLSSCLLIHLIIQSKHFCLLDLSLRIWKLKYIKQ